MNADQLLQYFDRLSEAPDAIPHLRRFILDLAVRGKLVEQDPTDEPATDLLKRIQAEKARLVEEGEIRDKRSLPEVPEHDAPYKLPLSWQWTRFANIAEFSAGRTPSRNDPTFWNNGEYSWVSIADMEDGQVLTATKERVSSKARERIFRAEPEKPSTIIMSFKLTIGKIARLGIPAFHNEAIISIYPYLADLDAYLFNVLPQFARQGNTKGAIKGATLNRDSISNILFPLPPLAEQHRIVAKVDELMNLCDELEVAKAEREQCRDSLVASSLQGLNQPDEDEATFREHARFTFNNLPRITTRATHIKQLRQAILNLAVRGRLVPQDPSDEPAVELLKRIAAEKARLSNAKGRRKVQDIRPMPAEKVLYAIPPGWVWVAFGDIMYSRDSERIPVSKEERSRRTKIYDYYGASGVIDKIDGFMFDKPLLLIGEDGANLVNRSTPIAFIARGKYWVNNHAHVLDGISEKFLRYMELSINATDLKPYVTGTAQPKMNQAKMNSIPIALSPLAEQYRIVAKVDELMAICDQMESQITVTEQDSRRFLEAVLNEALSPAFTEAI